MNPDLLPGVDLVTEEVEPGVYRVVDDGLRDLSGIGLGRQRGHTFSPAGLAVGPDGDVFLHTAPAAGSRSGTGADQLGTGLAPDAWKAGGVLRRGQCGHVGFAR